METNLVNTQNPAESNNSNLSNEIQQMLSYVYQKGIKIPDTLSKQSLSNETSAIDTTALISDYNALSAAILPSTPESIKFIGKEFSGDISVVKSWEIPLVKKYIVLTVIALIALIGISLLPQVNSENQDKSILALSGTTLFYNLLFICIASLLGVMFYILKNIKDKIDTVTLTPVDIFSFNISVIIGVVSGFIISELFAFTTSIMGSSIEVHKMTLALLGGFSSDAIFTVLHSIVNKIKTIFST